jgi:hypothetical protein
MKKWMSIAVGVGVFVIFHLTPSMALRDSRF